MRRRARILVVLAAAVACGALLFIPAKVGAAALAHRAGAPSLREPATTSGTAQAFSGVAAVGALFTVSGGVLGKHFCTASVVHSARGDLAVTAAHCVTGVPGQVVFVPGYFRGKQPYGAWPVTAVYTSPAWQASQDPDDDVAFLRLADAPGRVPVENVTGAERLVTGRQQPALVQVIGYPNTADQPVSCANWTKSFSPTQLEFDCGGYTDGTSGSPFLTDVSPATGQGTLIGLIGGYQQGGNTPEVSYTSAFGPAVTALYQQAAAGG
ncbi:MAG TPA: trypsin-like serine protease [Trebonia sp.]